MTTRITEVSAEASDTGRHAADARENATGLNEAIKDHRHSAIRVMRTSTTEVDRRDSERFNVKQLCGLTVGGQTHGARLADRSDTGAHVRGTPALQVGTRGTREIDGVDHFHRA